MTRLDVAEAARSCLRKRNGVLQHPQQRWKHAQRKVEGAIDCGGLTLAVLAKLGIPFQDDRRYSLGQDNTALFKRVFDAACERFHGDPALADIVLFRYQDVPTHCGVVTPEGTLVHVPWERCVIEEPFGPWLERVVASWTIPGVSR